MAQRLRNTKERNGKRDFAIQKHQGCPQEKATATAWRISEDFAKRVSAKPRSAPCRLLRNWVCFYAKTCRSLARAYACALVSKTTARLTGKLLKSILNTHCRVCLMRPCPLQPLCALRRFRVVQFLRVFHRCYCVIFVSVLHRISHRTSNFILLPFSFAV